MNPEAKLPYTSEYSPSHNDVTLDIPRGDYLAKLDQLFECDGSDQFAPTGCGRKLYRLTLTPFVDQELTISDIPFANRGCKA